MFYTDMYSNIHNLSDKLPKTPEKTRFLETQFITITQTYGSFTLHGTGKGTRNGKWVFLFLVPIPVPV